MADHNLIEELISRLEGGGMPDQTGMDGLENPTGRLSRRAGRQLLGRLLEGCEETPPPPTTRCRWCGMEANYVSRRPGYVSTCFGAVRYRRAYYVCPDCYRSTCPLDERLDPIASLARLRKRLADGAPLMVAEIARAWRLGTLNASLAEHRALDQQGLHEPALESSENGHRTSATARGYPVSLSSGWAGVGNWNAMRRCIDARTIQ